jgi:hypothetical protein
MKKWIASLVAVALSFGAGYASAEELKSGLAAGEKIPAFIVTKIGGADSDGVEVGKDLCYRCKNGARPQVMVFTRTTSGEVVNLTKELNAAVTKNEAAQLTSFVNVMNSDKAAAEKAAKELLAGGSANVPVVVPVENENGPANYGINPDAEVTVLIAKNQQVIASHGYAKGQFDSSAVKSVLAEVQNAVK